tara:strand:+ start:2493 stop:3119 length:627 start_codon:yes stop_codon:yes gene_type:complete
VVLVGFVKKGIGDLKDILKKNMCWVPSGSSTWEQPNSTTFIFKSYKGQIGSAVGDNQPMPGKYLFKERQEARTDYLGPGHYVWNADVEILADKLFHAPVFYLMQLHDDRNHGSPSASVTINDRKIFINSEDGKTQIPQKYTGKHHIETDFNYNGGSSAKIKIVLDYKDEVIFDSNITTGLYLKFGVYRWNAICDVKQTYTNVTFEKIG